MIVIMTMLLSNVEIESTQPRDCTAPAMIPKENRPESAVTELRGLLRDVPLAYFRLKATGDVLAARAGQTTGKWGVMRTLDAEGPQTVAQIARSRPVARQWVQKLA